MERISFSNIDDPGNGLEHRFTLDGSGVSAIQLSEILDFSAITGGGTATLSLQNPSLFAPPADILLFDLALGSIGGFTDLIVGGNSFAATEGTIVQVLGSATDYKFTYNLNGGGDIGLTVVPEPQTLLLFACGALGLFALRRRQYRPRCL